MSFSRDVVIVGGCGHVGLPLGLVLADAGLSVTLYDRRRQRGRPGPRRQDAVLGARRRRAARAAHRDRPARRHDRPELGVARPSTSCVVVGHAGRRAPQPRPEVRAASRSRACSTSSATASTSSCAAPCTRGVTAMVEKLLAAADRDDRRVVLPGAHRRGQGARGAALAPADRVGAHRARGASGPKSCSARSRRRSSTSTSKRPSSRSSSPTRGATSSSRPPTSCS